MAARGMGLPCCTPSSSETPTTLGLGRRNLSRRIWSLGFSADSCWARAAPAKSRIACKNKQSVSSWLLVYPRCICVTYLFVFGASIVVVDMTLDAPKNYDQLCPLQRTAAMSNLTSPMSSVKFPIQGNIICLHSLTKSSWTLTKSSEVSRQNNGRHN